MTMDSSELIKQILPLLIPQIEGMIQGASVGGAVPSPHALNSAHHSGVLADTQAPQFLKTDGSRNLTGNLAVSAGATIDGIDLSAMSAGTLSAASGNSASLAGAHTHLITASAAPGASQALLKTDTSGMLTLQGLTLGALTTGGGILFTTLAGVVSQDNLFVYDATNDRLGVGVGSPAQRVHSSVVGGGGVAYFAENTGASTTAYLVALRGTSGVSPDQVSFDLNAIPKNYTTIALADSAQFYTASATHLDLRNATASGDIRFLFGTVANYVFTSTYAAFDTALTVSGAAAPLYAGWDLQVEGNGIIQTSSILDAATKNARLATAHYLLAEEPFMPVGGQSSVTANIVFIGGGYAVVNAATQIRFYMAANNATVTGSEVTRITGSAGSWGIGIGNTSPAAQVDILSTSDNLRLRYDLSNYATLNAQSSGSLEIVTVGSTAANAVLTLKPGGSIVLQPSPSTSTGDVLPDANYRVNLGAINQKFLTLHAAELWVETLVAQETIATIGGRVLVGPTTTLTRDITNVATQIFVKHNQMVSGDRVYLEANGKIEFMAITSAPTTINGTPPNTEYRYNVTRNLDATGANAWYAGDAVFNTGQATNGWIDLYSVRGLKYTVSGGVKTWSQFGPAIVMNVRNSATFNDWTEYAAFGNLRGVYGYGSDTYGVAFGKYQMSAGSTYITIDASNGYRLLNGTTVIGQWAASGVVTVGDTAQSHVRMDTGVLRIRTGSTDKIVLDASGNMSLTGVLSLGTSGGIYQGSGTFTSPTTGLKVWNDSGTGRIGGYNAGTLQWYAGTDGKLYAGGGNVVLESTGLSIIPGSAYDALRAYAFKTGSTVNSTIVGFVTASTSTLQLDLPRYSGISTFLSQTVDAVAPATSQITLAALQGGSAKATLVVEALNTGSGRISMTGTTIAMSGVLERGGVQSGGGIYFGLATPSEHASYTNATVAVGGWTAIPLSGFSPGITGSPTAVFVRMTAQFSAAAQTNWIALSGSSSATNYPVLLCRAIVANISIDQTGIVKVDPNGGTPAIWVKVSGALSATQVYIQIYGFFM